MQPVLRGLATLSTAIMLAACSGTGTPTQGPGAATNPPATQAAAICADSTATTTVSATVKDNTWSQPISAKVTDVVTWTNNDTVPHRVEFDDLSCVQGANIAGGASASMSFSKAGSYPFHCKVHPSMKGTITIT